MVLDSPAHPPKRAGRLQERERVGVRALGLDAGATEEPVQLVDGAIELGVGVAGRRHLSRAIRPAVDVEARGSGARDHSSSHRCPLSAASCQLRGGGVPGSSSSNASEGTESRCSAGTYPHQKTLAHHDTRRATGAARSVTSCSAPVRSAMERA